MNEDLDKKKMSLAAGKDAYIVLNGEKIPVKEGEYVLGASERIYVDLEETKDGIS